MRDLSASLSSSGRGILALSPESRLLVTFLASVFSLVFGDPYSLGVLLCASAVYLAL